jgi:glycerol-3-phosphate dehydrogenase
VIIIGAGLLGCFTARSLARYNLRIAVVERENDVCMGISRANSAIVYSGADTKPGTLKTRLTITGNRSFPTLCEELHVPFSRCGSLMLAFGPRAEATLDFKYEQGLRNGVVGLRLLNTAETLGLEPRVAPSVTRALLAPSTGTVNPWELCIAAAQNAHANGVAFFLEHEVSAISAHDACTSRPTTAPHDACASRDATDSRSGPTERPTTAPRAATPSHAPSHVTPAYAATPAYTLSFTNGRRLTTRTVVNCTGLDACRISELVAAPSFRIIPSRGDYLILDDRIGKLINRVIFHEPEQKGKGATLVPTIDGNIMVGPSEVALAPQELAGARAGARSTSARFDTRTFPTTATGMAFNRRLAHEVVPTLPLDETIRSFATMRPNLYWAEPTANGTVRISDESISTFHIAEAPDCPGFINVAGIKTPGLTCAAGIGEEAARLVIERLGETAEKPGFDPIRPAPLRFNRLTPDERNRLSGDLEIVCRCRQVTEGEIRDAIREPLGARTLDGVKRRCGTGMGRCQGGYCTQRVIELLAEELACRPEDIPKDRSGSTIVTGKLLS